MMTCKCNRIDDIHKNDRDGFNCDKCDGTIQQKPSATIIPIKGGDFYRFATAASETQHG